LNETLEYFVTHRSRVRNIRIKVNGLGKVEVVAPVYASPREIKEFVDQNLPWIEQSKSKLRDQRLSDPNLGLNIPGQIDLKAIPISYKVNTLDIVQKPALLENNRTLQLFSKCENKSRELLRNWLHTKAKSILVPTLQQSSNLYQIKFNKVSIRGQKTRWGSCSTLGNINLNRNLLFLPPELVSYLMLHELCHIVQPNHSHRFWSLVESFEPKFRDYEKALNQSHTLVPLWAYKSI